MRWVCLLSRAAAVMMCAVELGQWDGHITPVRPCSSTPPWTLCPLRPRVLVHDNSDEVILCKRRSIVSFVLLLLVVVAAVGPCRTCRQPLLRYVLPARGLALARR
jgi:hypothetical protein